MTFNKQYSTKGGACRSDGEGEGVGVRVKRDRGENFNVDK